MSKKDHIPVNIMTDESDSGIVIESMRIDEQLLSDTAMLEAAQQSHRHATHAFFLLEKGSIRIEIDFQKYTIKAPSLIYVHPDQVHRTIIAKQVTVSTWSLSNENLNPEYLQLLEVLTPAPPLVLNKTDFALLSEAITVTLKFAERRKDKLYHAVLKDSCNALVALVLAQYAATVSATTKPSRFETISKGFKALLEKNYATVKSPAAYAKLLHVSTAYLNECVKHSTGHSVTHHIQERILLQAKRWLYYADRSIKEIAQELGYDDAAYFSRLFTKLAGTSAVAFRNKNHG